MVTCVGVYDICRNCFPPLGLPARPVFVVAGEQLGNEMCTFTFSYMGDVSIALQKLSTKSRDNCPLNTWYQVRTTPAAGTPLANLCPGGLVHGADLI